MDATVWLRASLLSIGLGPASASIIAVDELRRPRAVGKGTLHSGSGCALGDLVAASFAP